MKYYLNSTNYQIEIHEVVVFSEDVKVESQNHRAWKARLEMTLNDHLVQTCMAKGPKMALSNTLLICFLKACTLRRLFQLMIILTVKTSLHQY